MNTYLLDETNASASIKCPTCEVVYTATADADHTQQDRVLHDVRSAISSKKIFP